MKIPYSLAGQISRLFPFPDQFYRVVQDTLIAADGLGLYVHYVSLDDDSPFNAKKGYPKMPTPQTAYLVMKHICLRTLPYNKIAEFVRIEKEMIRGIPTIGIAGIPLGKKTIIDALYGLHYRGILLRIALPNSKAVTKAYGLNLPMIFDELEWRWRNEIKKATDGNSEKARSLLSLQAQRNLLPIIRYLYHFKSYFHEFHEITAAKIYNTEEFLDHMKALQDVLFTRKYSLESKGGKEINITRKAQINLSVLADEFKNAIRNCRVKKKDLVPEKWQTYTT